MKINEKIKQESLTRLTPEQVNICWNKATSSRLRLAVRLLIIEAQGTLPMCLLWSAPRFVCI